MKPKLIIVEGAQGVGKTTITNWLRDNIQSSNLYRLSGIQDNSVAGRRNTSNMYNALCHYINVLGANECGMHMIFDRIWITEQVYSKLGYKNYDYTESYTEHMYWMSKIINKYYDVHIVCLYLQDESLYADRLKRDRGSYKHAQYSAESSIKQEAQYMATVMDIQAEYSSIMVHVIAADKQKQWEKDLSEIFSDVVRK